MGIENRVNSLFRTLVFALLALNCRAAIVPIQETVFTTNTFDANIVSGAMIYFDYPSGKFVATTTSYTNGIFYEPTIGFLSIVHTNSTGDALLNLSEGGPAGASIQGYADKFVAANTNLTFDAVGPYSIRLRVNGSNLVEVAQDSVSVQRLLMLSGLPVGSQMFYSSFPTGGSAYFTNIYAKNLPSGDNNILTVPAGYRFVPIRAVIIPTNISACWVSVLTNGVTTQLRASGNVSTNGTALLFSSFVFEQNETVVIHSATNANRADISGLMFTNSIPLKSYRNLAMSNGDNTLYTVPANTYAVAYVPPGSSLQQNLQYFNGTAATTVNKTVYLIPSGGVQDLNTRYVVNTVAAQAEGNSSMNPILFPGDSIVINVNSGSAGQVAWITVWEQ